MSHNDNIFTVFKTTTDALAERAGQGYTGGQTSTDGLLIVGDRGTDVTPTITDPPTKPSYVTEAMPNFPHLDHDETKAFIAYKSTVEGGSDGFNYGKGD